MDEERIAHLLRSVRGGAVRYTQCCDATSFEKCQVLVLDTIGMLSSVYGYADWAYIGGGFGVGIHNTLEAATFGLPLAFGPNYAKFKEARELIAIGGARSVANAGELIGWFSPLRDDETTYRETACRIKAYTSQHQGATKQIVDTVFRQ